MEIKIKKATQEDSKIVIRFLKELYLELGEEKESIEYLDEEFLSDFFATETTKIFLAFFNEIQVGIITLTESQAIYTGGKFGLIDELFVLPEFRSIQIGQKLLDFIKEIGKQNNWKRIDVTAPSDSKFERTVNFYKRNGFVFTGPKLKFKV
ncbi:MAG: GNAT family N-acetyltransferase [Calditrichaeota bacterium]|nr:MAG: GNAT family N-acetyltransferase [Calditrichota bacterium]